MEDFDQEADIAEYYEVNEETNKKVISLEHIKKLKAPLYAFVNVKETCSTLDLKKEVILTMINSLEKSDKFKSFFKLEGMLPASVGLRFHNEKPEVIAKENDLVRAILELAKEY